MLLLCGGDLLRRGAGLMLGLRCRHLRLREWLALLYELRCRGVRDGGRVRLRPLPLRLLRLGDGELSLCRMLRRALRLFDRRDPLRRLRGRLVGVGVEQVMHNVPRRLLRRRRRVRLLVLLRRELLGELGELGLLHLPRGGLHPVVWALPGVLEMRRGDLLRSGRRLHVPLLRRGQVHGVERELCLRALPRGLLLPHGEPPGRPVHVRQRDVQTPRGVLLPQWISRANASSAKLLLNSRRK